MRTFALLALIAFTRCWAADFAVIVATTTKITVSGVIDDRHAYEYRPDISLLFSGWRDGGLVIPIGSDESGRIVSLAPLRITLRTAAGSVIEAIDDRSEQSFFPAELRAPDHIHIRLPVSHGRAFRIVRPGSYLLRIEVILASREKKEAPIVLPDVQITIVAKKAEQVAAANGYGCHASCCAGDHASRSRG
jgi:hypothetical protein